MKPATVEYLVILLSLLRGADRLELNKIFGKGKVQDALKTISEKEKLRAKPGRPKKKKT